MAFASSRGYHRLACAMEDAGLILHPSIFNYRTGEVVDVPSLLGWSFGSGFPKSTRIDTKIDREHGLLELRGLKEVKTDKLDTWLVQQGGQTSHWIHDAYTRGEKTVLVPADNPQHPLAQAWAGHRYGLQALKPALEPVIVAQVPYQGRPMDSITQTGAGALNIDGSRISCEPIHTSRNVSLGSSSGGIYGAANTPAEFESHPNGRWPANLALQHTPRCRPLGTRQVRNGSGPASGPTAHKIGGNGGIFVAPDGHRETVPYYASPDGTEVVPAWACAEGCPVRALDGQAGERPTSGRHGEERQWGTFRDVW